MQIQLAVQFSVVVLFAPLTHAYALHTWADAHRVKRAVDVGPSGFGGNGLVARRRLSAGEQVLSIAKELTLATPKLDESGLHWGTRLAIAMRDAGQSSIHYATLPAPPRVLHRWSDASLAELQNATLTAEALRWRETRQEQFRLASASGTWESDDEPRFFDLYDLACSRAIGARGDDEMLRLIPLLDMAQHCHSGGQFAMRGSSMCLITGGAYEAGAEVFLDYGARTSDEYALQYGFVPSPRNPHDGVLLPVDGGGGSVDWPAVQRGLPTAVRDACASLLAAQPASLGDDVSELRAVESRGPEHAGGDEAEELMTALRYRIGKKQLLAAAAGMPAASAATSAFAMQ